MEKFSREMLGMDCCSSIQQWLEINGSILAVYGNDRKVWAAAFDIYELPYDSSSQSGGSGLQTEAFH